MIPPKLSVDSEGRVHGANVTWNSPWPCVNGDNGGMAVPHGIMGVVMHTMVGDLPGTIAVFNNPAFQASAHFGIDQDGMIHQFGPVSGWKAWAQEAGNANWYSIEHADAGQPDNPLTQAQINASAQLVELLSRPGVGNFSLQISNSTSTEGYGVHYMGGQNWGGHTCPQDENGNGPRAGQRAAILNIAEAIRTGNYPRQQTGIVHSATTGGSAEVTTADGGIIWKFGGTTPGTPLAQTGTVTSDTTGRTAQVKTTDGGLTWNYAGV